MYYIGTCGNKYYIINDKDNEGAWFSPFGEYQGLTTSRLARIDVMNKVFPVDVISILGNGAISKKSDVYINGYRAIVNKPLMDIVRTLQTEYISLRRNTIMYRIPHENNVSQVLMVFKKGSIRKEKLAYSLGVDVSLFKETN